MLQPRSSETHPKTRHHILTSQSRLDRTNNYEADKLNSIKVRFGQRLLGSKNHTITLNFEN